jgi:hypothetical protein
MTRSKAAIRLERALGERFSKAFWTDRTGQNVAYFLYVASFVVASARDLCYNYRQLSLARSWHSLLEQPSPIMVPGDSSMAESMDNKKPDVVDVVRTDSVIAVKSMSAAVAANTQIISHVLNSYKLSPEYKLQHEKKQQDK